MSALLDLNSQFIWFFGEVVSVDDPLKIGRVRVKAYPYYEDIADDDLPWAQCLQTMQSAASSGIGLSPTGIAVGTGVVGFFIDGVASQMPFVMGTFAGEGDVSTYALGTASKRRNLTIPNEPANPYAAQYPHNKTLTTESGHVIEIDDSPSAERINVKHKSGSYVEFHPDGSLVVKTAKDFYNLSAGNHTVFVNGSATIQVKGDMLAQVTGMATVQSSDIIRLEAPQIEINHAEFELGDIIMTDVEDDNDPPETGATQAEHAQSLNTYNNALPEGTSPMTVEQVQVPSPTTASPIRVNCGNYTTSSNFFTLNGQNIGVAEFTTNVVVNPNHHHLPNVSKSWRGKTLTKDEIVCNLAALAENCVKPIFEHFGIQNFGTASARINSGFRTNGGTSQHEAGQACDLQWAFGSSLASKQAARDKSIEIAQWIIGNVNYDQLILEYSDNNFPACWVHVSFNRDGNRPVSALNKYGTYNARLQPPYIWNSQDVHLRRYG